MTIVSSVIVSNKQAADGVREIVERHIFDDGPDEVVVYTAASGADPDALMAARAPLLEAARARETAYLRNRSLRLSVEARVASFLAAQSDAQMRTNLGLTPSEVAAFRAGFE